MTIPLLITAADETTGTPTEAKCEHCGATWSRPALDTNAESLVAFAYHHQHVEAP